MGYSPIKPKKTEEVIMIFNDKETAQELSPHKHILLLRKSAAKLRQYMDCFVNTKYPAGQLIEIKYHFSKCRPEVLAMMESMANDPKRFEFSSIDHGRKAMIDKVTDTTFQLYNFSPTPLQYEPKLYINGHEFLTDIELICVSRVIESLAIMSSNEYKLQEELKTLEEQKNVFQIYQSEKLSSR